MPNDEEATRAMAAVNGKELDGRALKVNEARPKPERSSGPRPGSGGRGPSRPRFEEYPEFPMGKREPRW